MPKESLYKELRLARPELPTFPSREELVLAFIQMMVPSEAKYTRRVQFGEYIFRQGNRGDPALYIVNAGDFEVLHQEPHLAEVKVSSLGRGECFGYVSLLSENPFNPKRFTVRCTSRLGKGEILSINGARGSRSRAPWPCCPPLHVLATTRRRRLSSPARPLPSRERPHGDDSATARPRDRRAHSHPRVRPSPVVGAQAHAQRV